MRRLVHMLIAALAAPALLATSATAKPGSGTRTLVSLGDSYISGEAGRWNGNSLDSSFSREGTDRAYVGWFSYDPAKVYVDGTYANGCHRSDVAEVRAAAARVGLSPVNLACSGAETINVLRTRSGGRAYQGEAPQADRLAQVAAETDVRAIVLSIGGNDLGFGDGVAACVQAYLLSTRWTKKTCHAEQSDLLDRRMPGAMSNVRRVIDDVHATMDAAGYDRDHYRFVLQSYPSPVPAARGMRHPENGTARVSAGCPLWDEDLDFARNVLVGRLADNLRAVADAEGVEFLDVRDLFDGHEACAKTAVTGGLASPAHLEWARYVSLGVLQGDKQESFHPNAVGQAALGACLAATFSQPGDEWTCRAGAGVPPGSVRLTTIRGKTPKAPRQRDEHVDIAPDLEPWMPSVDDVARALDLRAHDRTDPARAPKADARKSKRRASRAR